MPEVKISIGGREFAVACQEGEEHYLLTAAKALDAEATAVSAGGRLPEGRMLLMAGLMLADKTAGVEEELRTARDRVATLESEVQTLKSATPEPEKVEVAVIPDIVTDTMAELAARAEAVAAQVEEKVAG